MIEPTVSSSAVGTLIRLVPGWADRSSAVLQLEVEGGPTFVTIAALVTFFVALVFAVLVTYRFVEGYRRTRSRPILLLAIGMFLLAPAPMFVRLIAGNTPLLSIELHSLLTTASELCGLLTILYVVYRG